MHNIRQPVAGIVFAIVLICLAPMAAARSFLSTIADVPLADGLHELPDAGFVFDKPQGRIVQLTASHKAQMTQQALMAFYQNSLPNLGWQASESASGLLTFTRRGEILRLTFTADLVIFDLTPMVAP
jgi:hypothetical protein